MKKYTVKVDDAAVGEFANLFYALAVAVRECTSRGVDASVLDEEGLVFYDVETVVEVFDDDLTFPAIVHVRSVLVGANA